MTAKEWLSQYPALNAKALYLMEKPETPEMMEQLKAAHEKMQAIEDAINAVQDDELSEVLYLRYLEGPTGRLMPWKDVSQAMYGGDSEKDILRTYRRHRLAREAVQIPLEAV